MPEPVEKRIQMLVFLKEGEDESYDQLAEIDRLDLRRKSVEVSPAAPRSRRGTR